MDTRATALTRLDTRFGGAICDLAAAALIVAALIVGLRTMEGLRGAHDPDQFRDIAQAQTVRDGHPLTDPYYRGEWIWYNPLLAWTLAIGSAAVHMPVETFYVRAGPWLNLFGPVGFYLLAAQLVGRRAAVGALALYLFFITGNEHSWATATYSPWLFAGNFSQALFFATGVAILWADRNPTWLRSAIAGVLIGLTFLAHTAPALILVAIACAMFLSRWRVILTIGLAAVVVASPFLFGIVWHYRLHVINDVPTTYIYPAVSREGIATTLRAHAWLIAAAALGLRGLRSRVLWWWLIGAVALTMTTIEGITPLVPAFHFWLYVTAGLAVLAGRTLAWLCRPAPILVALVCAAVVHGWHPYVNRPDFQLGRFLSARRVEDHLTAAAFLRTVTAQDDVVLGTDPVVRLIIGPAGRKTVAPSDLFANPFVEYRSRAADRDQMLAAIEARDRRTFASLAERRGVNAVVTTGTDSCAAAESMFPLTWRIHEVCISVVRDAS